VLEPRTLRLPLTPPVKPHTRRANNTSAIDTYPRLTFNEVLIYYHYHHIFNSHDPQLNRIILIHLPFDAYHIHNIISCYSIPNNSKHINFNHLNFHLSSYSQFNHTHTHTHTHTHIYPTSCYIFTCSFMHISTLSHYYIFIHNTNLMHSSISIYQHILYSQHKSHAILNINSMSCHHSQYKSYAFFNVNSSTYFIFTI